MRGKIQQNEDKSGTISTKKLPRPKGSPLILRGIIHVCQRKEDHLVNELVSADADLTGFFIQNVQGIR